MPPGSFFGGSGSARAGKAEALVAGTRGFLATGAVTPRTNGDGRDFVWEEAGKNST